MLKNIISALLLVLILSPAVKAQNNFKKKPATLMQTDIRSGWEENLVMHARRLNLGEEFILDGKLTESIWNQAPVATGFTQRFPNDGKRATQETNVQVLYDDTHIYIGIRAMDMSPDSIQAPLFRRDGNEASDWVYVSFDSYDDQRTAFAFGINPRGVQKDILIYDDTNEDLLWDAVWESATRIHDEGWNAELKIPLSQLRFDSKSNVQSWGFNVQRRVSRNGEVSFWAPTPQNETGMVSKFGTLLGIQNLKEPRRLEVTPYASGSLTREPNLNSGNPFYESNDITNNMGGDVKYGITSDLTITATINPDFGQVEADPAVINLSANENFFREQRPFFLEGNDIFQFGNTRTYSRSWRPNTFYSRRIGRSPQGNSGAAGIDASYTHVPDLTTIATAAKLSGKTKNGWSIGVLDAVTLKENAQFVNKEGIEGDFMVEPPANYLVARTKKDFNNGDTFIGAFGTAVNRSLGSSYLNDYLRNSAYVAGLDYEHNFGNRNWVTSGAVSFSSVHGSKEAISRTQRSPVRRFDRVDSDYLSVDADKTSLNGFATEISVQKRGGQDHWLGSFTYAEVSPGYEVNDLGFQSRSDFRSFNTGVIYRENNPDKLLYYDMWMFTGQGWNYDGNRINNHYSIGGNFQFKNQWRINVNANHGSLQYMDRITRGGPVMQRAKDINGNVNINTNPNKALSFNIGTFQRTDELGEYDHSIWAGITYIPAPNIQLSVEPRYTWQKDVDQYVRALNDDLANNPYGTRYIFSNIHQKTFSTEIRLNWTFSTKISLQTFVRPFVSTGDYSRFKEFNDAGSMNFDEYGSDIGNIALNDNVYTIDPDGAGPAASFNLSNPDFNFRAVQGNAVFRYEYRPGSVFFIVWQQQRQDFARVGDFDINRDLGELIRSKPTNIFLLKFSYWFGS